MLCGYRMLWTCSRARPALVWGPQSEERTGWVWRYGRVGRWSRGQAERGQGEDAGSTHTAQPPSPSTENSRAPRITPGTSLASLPRSAGTFGSLSQLTAHPTAPCHSPGRVEGSSEASNSPSADNSDCEMTSRSTPDSTKPRFFCYFIKI